MRIRKKVTGIITNSFNKILICRYSGDNSGKGRDLPGGGLKDQECELDGLKREIYEEIGLKEYQFKIENNINKRYYKKYNQPIILQNENNTTTEYYGKSESFYIVKTNNDNIIININITNEFDKIKWVRLEELDKYIENKEKVLFIKDIIQKTIEEAPKN